MLPFPLNWQDLPLLREQPFLPGGHARGRWRRTLENVLIGMDRSSFSSLDHGRIRLFGRSGEGTDEPVPGAGCMPQGMGSSRDIVTHSAVSLLATATAPVWEPAPSPSPPADPQDAEEVEDPTIPQVTGRSLQDSWHNILHQHLNPLSGNPIEHVGGKQ